MFPMKIPNQFAMMFIHNDIIKSDLILRIKHAAYLFFAAFNLILEHQYMYIVNLCVRKLNEKNT